MNWFTNLNTAPRLLLGFGVVILLLGAAVLTGYRGMANVRDQSELAILIGELDANLHETRTLVMTMLATASNGGHAATRDEVAANTTRNDELVRRLELATRDDPTFAERVRDVARLRDEHRRVREQQVLARLGREQDGESTMSQRP